MNVTTQLTLRRAAHLVPAVSPYRSRRDRASLSALLKTAQGDGQRRWRTGAKFFNAARGSVMDARLAWMRCRERTLHQEEIRKGKEVLVRVSSTLTKLITLFDSSPSTVVREESPEDEIEDEDKNGTPGANPRRSS